MAKRNTLIPLKDKIKVLVDSYERLEAYIKNQLFGIQRYDKNQINRIKGNIYDRIKRQDKFNLMWTAQNIPRSYNDSASISKAKLEKLGKKPQKKLFQQISIASKKKSMLKMLQYMENANDQILARVNTFFRLMKRSQKTLNIQNRADWWSEPILEGVEEIKFWSLTPALRTTDKGITYMAVPARHEVQKKTQKLFKKIFGDFDFIQIPLKTGGVRNYKPNVYMEMVARTEMRMGQTQALKDRSKEYDNDLVQLSNHDNPCPICEPFQGMIFSLSGTDKVYPPAIDVPLHPNCEDNYDPISREAIAFEKSLAKEQDLSSPFKTPDWDLTIESRLADLKTARKAA